MAGYDTLTDARVLLAAASKTRLYCLKQVWLAFANEAEVVSKFNILEKQINHTMENVNQNIS